MNLQGGPGGGGGGPDWSGLLKWSLAQTGDGTSPAAERKPMSEEERKWFYHAMESLVEDEGERLKQDMLVLAQKQCPENARCTALLPRTLCGRHACLQKWKPFVEFAKR